eukprot:PhM_4_TR7593/c0_g1_i1/m.47613
MEGENDIEFDYVDEYDTDLECAICLLPWTNPRELRCGHIFCLKCIQPLRLCPACRAPFHARKTRSPNRVLLNMVARLNVKCLKCSWTGARENVESHPCSNKHGIVMKEGHMFSGGFQNGTFNGTGTYTWPRQGLLQKSYTGGFLEGHRNGAGRTTYSRLLVDDNDKATLFMSYEGTYALGKRNGGGVLTYHKSNTNNDDDDIIFEGQFMGGLPCVGAVKTQQGSVVYEGTFKEGRFSGTGVYTWPDGTQYEGSFLKGLPHGRGKKTFSPSGTVYEGDFYEGKFHGRGCILWGGEVQGGYEGAFVRGEMHGLGALSTLSFYYNGEFVRGQMTGKGSKTWHSDEAVYEGQFVDGKRHGHGRTYYPRTQSCYIGDYSDDKRSGWGKYKVVATPESDTGGSPTTTRLVVLMYEGEHQNGKRHGQGKIFYGDGSSYEGEFRHNKSDGHGVFKWSDGRSFVGEFVKGMQQRFGFYRWPDGRSFEGAMNEHFTSAKVKKEEWSDTDIEEEDVNESNDFLNQVSIESEVLELSAGCKETRGENTNGHAKRSRSEMEH